MCMTAAVMMAVGTGIQAGTAIQQGRNAEAYAEYQAKVAQRDANTAEAAGRVTAEKIRRAGRVAKADAIAAVAASGMDINSASANDVVLGIGRDFEADALAAIYSGQNEGMVRRSEGSAALANGRAQRSSALASGAAAAAGGWSRANPMRVAAPISRRDVGYMQSSGNRNPNNIYVG